MHVYVYIHICMYIYIYISEKLLDDVALSEICQLESVSWSLCGAEVHPQFLCFITLESGVE